MWSPSQSHTADRRWPLRQYSRNKVDSKMMHTVCLRQATFGVALCIAAAALFASGADEPFGRFRLKAPRFLQSPDYDEKSPEGMLSWTKDFQYVPARAAEPFAPDSPIHVPERNAAQEQFRGLHEQENELFRAEEKGPEKLPEGVRVASGLAVDDVGNQSQAYGLAPGEISMPGTVPLCRAYSNPALSIADWGSPAQWVTTTEFGVVRLTTSGVAPVSAPTTLFLRDHECNAAVVSANIRCEDNSVAGLAFRAESDANMYSVLLDTPRKAVSLNKIEDGNPSVISEIFMSYLHPYMRHQLKIVDHGKDGTIQVYLDQMLVLTHSAPYTGVGNTGVLVTKGHASFDNFQLLP
ncbi:hypothetical protein TGGT1_216940 [Toxoplasma gondii GT1]|uniref:Uncharacterized protein n=6 Tax=Toxoplasma gondii TaxID=5811 RepID=S7UL35_TOXGG|nr:hypothetical protein TGGT1_216940 [Toxoplasma gondii GT1]KAF4639792.1 hypothetical protein TGRH88_055640 [Toxoplasma gondii]KFG31521.1 putative transmembrane protein [Toxoplasma gondii p89]KFH01247.1 putative transmembrane protein [Toxoplasma gondii VAND]KFH10953.1 putative transmembrane protein [Toxoplasma gondii MAS]RQX67235.1 putative transmembrane protein [Toxoplasma gondii CAST]